MQARALPEGWRHTDALIALALALVGCFLAWMSMIAGASLFTQPLWQQCVGSLLIALPLVWRRHRPLCAGAIQAVLYFVAATWLGIDLYASQVALFLGFYSIGAWSPRRRAALVERIIIVVAMGGWLVTTVLHQFADIHRTQHIIAVELLAFLAINGTVNLAYFTAAWIFGNRAWQQAVERDELHRANEIVAALQAELVETAIEDERLRIARELHDVVAHHVTAMSVQASAARRLLPQDLGRAQQSLQHIEASARAAVQDLRSMVLTLRTSDDSTGSLPTLADLDALIDGARDTVRDASFEMIDEVPELSPAVELILYRVAQEALTNVAKHAGPGASVVVRLRGTSEGVELEVSDDGVGSATGLPGSGTGLQGMQERVRAVGGTVEAGPKPRGGFRVRAAIPIGALG